MDYRIKGGGSSKKKENHLKKYEIEKKTVLFFLMLSCTKRSAHVVIYQFELALLEQFFCIWIKRV